MTRETQAKTIFSLLTVFLLSSPAAIAEPEDILPDRSALTETANEGTPSDIDSVSTKEDGASENTTQNQMSTGARDVRPAENTNLNATAAPPSKTANELTIATWGGAYADSQKIAFFDPFTKKTGVKIMQKTHSGGLKMLRSRLESEDTPWDVIDLSLQTVDQACELGLLEQIDHGDLKDAPDGTSVTADFLPDGLRKCGVASVAWSLAIVYDKRKMKKKSKPATARDFFNIKRFPGKRSMRRGPKLNLELALLADGVAPSDVYNMLETDEGLYRALNRMEKLRGNIVWWDRGHEPLKHLSDGKAAMATAFNGRIFSTIAGEQQPFGIIWDGQIYNIDLWAVPKGAKNRERAFEFIAFATQTDRLAQQAKWFPYGPMRKSAVRQIGEHAEAGLKMAPYIPTAAKNFENALRIDEAWWDQHNNKMTAIFEAWLIGPQDKPGDGNSFAIESE